MTLHPTLVPTAGQSIAHNLPYVDDVAPIAMAASATPPSRITLATTHSQRKQLILCPLLSGVLSPAGWSGLRSRPDTGRDSARSGSPLWA